MSDDLTVMGGGELFSDSITGANPVSFTTGAIGSPFTLDSIRFNLSSTGVTSEDMTITINSAKGSTFDTVVDRQNMQGLDGFIQTYSGVECGVGDSIDVAYPNTDESTVTTVLIVGGI